MRIALCFSGQPNTWQHTLPTVRAYFAAHEVDVYHHHWSDTNGDIIAAMTAAYNPCAVMVSPRPDFTAKKAAMKDRFGPFGTPFSFDMFAAIQQSLGQALDPGRSYDWIVRLRYDTVCDGVCPDMAFPNGDSTIVVPKNFSPVGGCNDQFAVGHPGAMETYGQMIDFLRASIADRSALPDRIFEPPTPIQLAKFANPEGYLAFKPEQALLWYLQRTGLAVSQEPLRITLLPKDDVGKPFSELATGPIDSREEAKLVRDNRDNSESQPGHKLGLYLPGHTTGLGKPGCT